MRVFKTPYLYFVLWLMSEFVPPLNPLSLDSGAFWISIFFANNFSVIMLSMTMYMALSYTSMIFKALSLTAVIITVSIMAINLAVWLSWVPKTSAMGLSFMMIVVGLQLFMCRFLFKTSTGGHLRPDPTRIYGVINKPHDFMGMLGLLWSGLGGGFSIYHNGYCYWFSREVGELVKTLDQDWYKGRRLIDYGPATPERIADLESMIGQKWSFWNNCFTVFARWRRRWS